MVATNFLLGFFCVSLPNLACVFIYAWCFMILKELSIWPRLGVSFWAKNLVEKFSDFMVTTYFL